MKRSKKKNLIIFISLLLLFIIFTAVVKIVDVKQIGPNDSNVGLSTINKAFHDIFGYNDLFYKISKYLGYISFLLVGLYALLGLKELIEKKKISKVNRNILLLGSFYVLVLVVYIFFEKVIINYRPVLENGVLEASYPSSHTILSICVCVSSMLVSKKIFHNVQNVKLLNISSLVLMIAIVLTRTLSGVHWLTDIIGGILISITLCFLFKTSLEAPKRVKKEKQDVKD